MASIHTGTAAAPVRRRRCGIAHRPQGNDADRFPLQTATFEITTLEEAAGLAALLAGACENAAAVLLGLSELLINAIEHGNLEIGYFEKSRLLSLGAWTAEVERRLALPEFAARKVRVEVGRSGSRLEITIIDAGSGFDWSNYLELSAARSLDSHGRGIALANKLAFNTLEYRGCGNTVAVSAVLRHPK